MENIFENSDFILMLNQAAGDRPDPDADETDGGMIYDLPEENEDNPGDFGTDNV